MEGDMKRIAPPSVTRDATEKLLRKMYISKVSCLLDKTGMKSTTTYPKSELIKLSIVKYSVCMRIWFLICLLTNLANFIY